MADSMADRFPLRDVYGTFNFLLLVGEEVVGGFSEVSGLARGQAMDQKPASDGESAQEERKSPVPSNYDSVALKRGVARSKCLSEWYEASLAGNDNAQRDVSIVLKDESNRPVMTWLL